MNYLINILKKKVVFGVIFSQILHRHVTKRTVDMYCVQHTTNVLQYTNALRATILEPQMLDQVLCKL